MWGFAEYDMGVVWWNGVSLRVDFRVFWGSWSVLVNLMLENSGERVRQTSNLGRVCRKLFQGS